MTGDLARTVRGAHPFEREFLGYAMIIGHPEPRGSDPAAHSARELRSRSWKRLPASDAKSKTFDLDTTIVSE